MTKSSATYNTTAVHIDEMTDDELEQFINENGVAFPGVMGSDFDVKPHLYGDDYADAMMKELGY